MGVKVGTAKSVYAGRAITVAEHNVLHGVSAPSAKGSVVHGNSLTENRYVDKKGNAVIQLVGKQLLSVVAITGSQLVSTGSRITDGMIPISVTTLGGRVAALAAEYQISDISRLIFEYVPTCPTSTVGAIAIFYENDIGVPSIMTGISELDHAASHGTDFIQVPVWDYGKLDVVPQAITEGFFNSDGSNIRDSVQGVVYIEAAATLGSTPTTFGNIYLTYEVSFVGETLDYSVSGIQTQQLTATFTAVTPVKGAPMMMNFTGAAAGYLTALFNAGTAPSSSAVILSSTVTQATGGSTSATFVIGTSPQVYQLALGMGFWVAINSIVANFPSSDYTNNSLVGYLCADMESAADVANGNMQSEGILRYAANAAVGGTFTLNSRTFSTDMDN